MSAFLFCSLSFAQPIREYTGQTLWELPNLHEAQVDIGLWALIIAKEHEPALDIPKYLKYIDGWAEVINSVITDRTEDVSVVAAAGEVMWKKGPWNGYRPVDYDYENPWADSSLSNYLETRRGNCVSMPTLLLAIVERIDPEIPFFGAHAPMHMYCILKDRATGKDWNIEGTNGGASSDLHIIETFNVAKEGIEKGAYMRPLSKKETLAGLITNLVHLELKNGNYQKSLEYVDLALQLFPKFGVALSQKGAILHTIGWEEVIMPIKAQKRKPTQEEQEKIDFFDREGNWYFETAKNSGGAR